MSVAMNLARLRRLRVSIELAQAKVKTLTDQRDELIADMLTAHEATGDVLGKAAGVSQPRTVQIKNAVNARREMERAATKAKGRRRLKVVSAAS
jgi:hypothetical protein